MGWKPRDGNGKAVSVTICASSYSSKTGLFLARQRAWMGSPMDEDDSRSGNCSQQSEPERKKRVSDNSPKARCCRGELVRQCPSSGCLDQFHFLKIDF